MTLKSSQNKRTVQSDSVEGEQINYYKILPAGAKRLTFHLREAVVHVIQERNSEVSMASLTVRQRKRKRCKKCNQELSHSAYIRHLSPTVCAEVQSNTVLPVESTPLSREDTMCESGTESQDLRDNIANEAETSESVVCHSSDNSPESSSDDESESPEGESPECISGSDVLSESDCNDHTNFSEQQSNSHQESMKPIAIQICMFLSFFQLCYRVSERAISLLLLFLKALLSWLSSFCPEIKTLHDVLPHNVYFMRKLLGRKSEIICFVVCQKCHSLYKYKDCVITYPSGMTESAKCSFVQYPKHPQLFRRTKCNTVLMKTVKHGSTSKLIPHAVYAYKSLESSVAKLFSQPGFVEKCNLWWSRTTPSSVHFTDIYDGKVWQDFQVVDGRPFLQLPNNLCLQLNLDWFNPFKHVQYSVGVLYFVVENLPRTDRYKLENIIVVGCIPGPKEPKKHINTYLKPIVDELLKLWHGKLLRTSSIFGIVPVRCALTCITCDLPATRKLCGFFIILCFARVFKVQKTFSL